MAACQVPQSIKLEHIQRRNTLRKTGHVKEPEQMIPCLEMSELDTWYILIPLQSFTILYVRFFFVLGKRHGLGWGPLGSLGGLLVPVIFWDWLYARNQPPRRAEPLSCLRKKWPKICPTCWNFVSIVYTLTMLNLWYCMRSQSCVLQARNMSFPSRNGV